MSKNSLGRFPSVRNNLQRKQSKQATLFTQTKDDYGSIESDKKLHETQPLTNSQTQLAKKIQNKLRMRKPSGSEKKLKESASGKDIDFGMEARTDFTSELKEQIENLWQNSQAVYDTLSNCGMNVSADGFKEELMKESSVIMCQLAKGSSLESVVVDKLQKKLSKLRCIKKCEEKQKSVNFMFDERLQKLSMVLKTR